MTNFAVSVHHGQKNIELAIALEALAHVGRRPVRDAASKGILRRSVGVKIGNNRLLIFAKYLILNDIEIRSAVPGGSLKAVRLNLAAFLVVKFSKLSFL